MRGKKKRKQSVFRQLSLMGAILMLVLFLAFVYSSWQMQKSWRENIWNTNQQLMAQIEGKMEEYHQLMTQIATVTAYSPTIYSYFFQDPVERAISIEDVNTVFSNTILLEQNIAGIYLYGREMDLIARRILKEMEQEGRQIDLKQYVDPDTPEYAEMLERIGREMNFTTLRYHRLDDLIASVGIDSEKLCTYCWDGRE